MSSHVFTRNESYYKPGFGVVDFQLGQAVDPDVAIPDAAVREAFLKRKSLVRPETPEAAAAQKKAAAVVAEEEFVAPPMVEMITPDAVEVGVVEADVPPAPKAKGRPAKNAS